MAKKRKRPGRRPLGKISFQFRMPPSVHQELARLADLHHTTMSDYAVDILVQHFEARKSKEEIRKVG
jgi:hypothetical protein